MIYQYDPTMRWFLQDIDAKSFEWPWENWDKYVIKVSMKEQVIRGFSIFQIVPNSVLILRLATHYHCRNEGVGSELLADIEAVAVRHQLQLICTMVHECNDLGIQFLCRRGFRAGKVNREFFSDGRDTINFYKSIE